MIFILYLQYCLLYIYNITVMKRKISLCSTKSVAYLYSNFAKQFKKSLQQNSIGQMLNSKQVLAVLNFMGFVDEQPMPQQIQLSKTLTKMLSDTHLYLSVRKNNLFKFLTVLCDIPQIKESVNSSFYEQQASGLAMDAEDDDQPMIIIQLGRFDQYGNWNCSQEEKQQIKIIFGSMISKRISRNQIQARKRPPKQIQLKQTTFKPKICPRSTKMAEQGFTKLKINLNQKVQNRLLLSRKNFNEKIKQQLNKSLQKQLQNCTFKPFTNSRCRLKSRSQSKQNMHMRSCSQDRLKIILDKGQIYKKRRQKLQQLKIKLNESLQLQNCTFKPQTTKHNQSTKYVYVRNRQKQIQRVRQARKQRQFVNQVKQRGYPTGVNWSQFINNKPNQSNSKMPILCIDLKILNEQHNINVYQGQNVMQRKVPANMWWKVEDLIRKSIQQCNDIKIQNNKIIAV